MHSVTGCAGFVILTVFWRIVEPHAQLRLTNEIKARISGYFLHYFIRNYEQVFASGLGTSDTAALIE